jgi:hypothetical protein
VHSAQQIHQVVAGLFDQLIMSREDLPHQVLVEPLTADGPPDVRRRSPQVMQALPHPFRELVRRGAKHLLLSRSGAEVLEQVAD